MRRENGLISITKGACRRALVRLVGRERLPRLALEAAGARKVASEALRGLALERFYDEEVGRPYGVDRKAKEELVERFQRNTQGIESGTTWMVHVVLAQEILSVPAGTCGVVIECGCWKGASTASLSLVCGLVGRRLIVCDSFEGLPEDDGEAAHDYPHIRAFGYYRKGMYSARLEEVRENVARFGDPSICEFLPGFFSESLKALTEPIVMAFLDVDLASSTRDCVKYVWPLLVDGGAVYTDDSCDMNVVRIWFDDPWWQEALGRQAPGYVGSGCGLALSPDFSSVGYARKVASPQESYGRVPWLHYPDGSAGPAGSSSENSP